MRALECSLANVNAPKMTATMSDDAAASEGEKKQQLVVSRRSICLG